MVFTTCCHNSFAARRLDSVIAVQRDFVPWQSGGRRQGKKEEQRQQNAVPRIDQPELRSAIYSSVRSLASTE